MVNYYQYVSVSTLAVSHNEACYGLLHELQMYIVLSVKNTMHVKYKNSPYYKGSLLWDSLPVMTRRGLNIKEYKKSINRIYHRYNDNIF